MISQTSVLVAAPIAAAATARGIDVADVVGPIVAGLNDTTAALGGFDMDNIAVDLPDYTGTVSEHTDVLEPVTTKLADVIRGAMYTISHYIKPLLTLADQRLRSRVSGQDILDTVFNYMNVVQVNLEPEFLKSPFCPAEIPASLINVNGVKLKDMLRGQFPAMTGEQLRDMIYLDIPVLETFFADPKEIESVYNCLFVEKNWYELYNGRAIDQGVLNPISPENVLDFRKFRPLVITNLIINYLANQDVPLEGVTGVSLNDYRLGLEMTRDALAGTLSIFRNTWLTKASAGLVVIDNQVKYEDVDYGQAAGGKVMTGTVSVGYNSAALEMFANDMDVSISELVVGMVFGKFRGVTFGDVLTDYEAIRAAANEYMNQLEIRLNENIVTIARDSLRDAFAELSVSEKFEALVDALDSEITPSLRIWNMLSERLDMGSFLHTGTLTAIARGESSFLQTGAAIELARIFKSDIAVEILITNNMAEPGPVEHQRKVLFNALTAAIVKRLLK